MADPAPYSRTERLLNLVMALRAARHAITRDAIRSQVRGYDPQASDEAFQRMFERDKEDLRAMGIAVTAVTDASGSVLGYRARSQPVPGDLALDREEMAVVALAARLWDRSGLAPAARNALAKLESRLGLTVPIATAEPTDPTVARAPAGALGGAGAALGDLMGAVAARRAVRFDYLKPGADQAPERRRVQPWRILWWHGTWYVVGQDEDRAAVRVFRVNRIVSRVTSSGPSGAVVVPDGFDARAAIGRFAADRPGTALLAIAPGRAASLRRAAALAGNPAPIPDRVADGAPSGWDVLVVDYQEQPAFLAQVAAVAGQVVVLDPPELRAAVREALDTVIRSCDRPESPSGLDLWVGPVTGSGLRRRRQGPPGTAREQLARMLALVPWLAANDGVTVAQAAAHFAVSPQQLMADLGSLITSGVDDWTLFDIQYWDPDGRIHMIDPLDLAEPLALTAEEVLALTVALEALAGLPGKGAEPAVGRVLAKLGTASGPDHGAGPVVDLRPDLPSGVVSVIESALAGGRTVELEYLVAARDELTTRVVDPISLMMVDGHTYLLAHCRTAGALRHFRLDRVIRAEVGTALAQPVVASPELAELPMVGRLARSGQEAVIDVAPGAAHRLESVPVARSWELPGGWTRVVLPFGEPAWLVGIVLASAGTICVRAPEELVSQVRDRAVAGRDLHG